jgi:hypothetical protein
LRAEYLADAPRRVAELWSSLERVQNGDPDGLGELRVLVHRIAGSGGGYGFPEVSRAAQAADDLCRGLLLRQSAVSASDAARLRELVQGVADAFARAHAPE